MGLRFHLENFVPLNKYDKETGYGYSVCRIGKEVVRAGDVRALPFPRPPFPRVGIKPEIE